MQQYIIKKNKAFLRITSPSMDTTFEIDRDCISKISTKNWRLRANGTAICKLSGSSLQGLIYYLYNGWYPCRVEYIDSNPNNLKAENLRGIL